MNVWSAYFQHRNSGVQTFPATGSTAEASSEGQDRLYTGSAPRMESDHPTKL